MRPMSLSETGKSTNQVSFSNLFEKGFNPSGNGGLSISEFAETLVIRHSYKTMHVRSWGAAWQTDAVGLPKCDFGLPSHLLLPSQLQQ